jgi:hypothetical protein
MTAVVVVDAGSEAGRRLGRWRCTRRCGGGRHRFGRPCSGHGLGLRGQRGQSGAQRCRPVSQAVQAQGLAGLFIGLQPAVAPTPQPSLQAGRAGVDPQHRLTLVGQGQRQLVVRIAGLQLAPGDQRSAESVDLTLAPANRLGAHLPQRRLIATGRQQTHAHLGKTGGAQRGYMNACAEAGADNQCMRIPPRFEYP